MTAWVLVVDDDEHIRKAHRRTLERAGYGVLTAADGRAAIDVLDEQPVDAVVTDLQMPVLDGLGLLGRMREAGLGIPVIVVTGRGTIEAAMEAVRLGAADFLEKPFQPDRLLLTLDNALRFERLQSEHVRLRAEHVAEPLLIGDSPPMRALRRLVDKVAPSDGRVLVQGESGTGKELVAEAIHRASDRRFGPFVKLNCAAVPAELVESELFGHEKGAFTGATAARRGRFELADAGTLFLDEIGDMPAQMQAKVLRVLQEGRLERVGGSRTIDVDVRVIAATNRDLQAMVDDGSFREDLYYRLDVVSIRVPPLRDRREDIGTLAQHFAARLAARGRPRVAFEVGALEALAAHDYPGNVRELQNLVERLAILCEGNLITQADVARQLPSLRSAAGRDDARLYRPGVPLRELMREVERRIVAEAIAANDGNKTAAARELEVDRSHFFKKLHTLGLANGD